MPPRSSKPEPPEHEPDPQDPALPGKIGHRPLKLTPKLQEDLTGHLRVGNYFEPSCRAVGIHPDTAYGWLERARTDHPEGIFSGFSVAVTRALAEAEVNTVLLLQVAAAGDTEHGVRADPRAALELLRRRYPERWGDTQKVTINTVAAEEIIAEVLEKVEGALEGSIADANVRKAAIAAVYSALVAGEGEGPTAAIST